MTNSLARTSFAAFIALSMTAAAMTVTQSPATAAPLYAKEHVQLVGGKHHGKKKKAQRAHQKKHKKQMLYPHQVVRILERRGFRNVRRVHFSQGKYHARARGYHGPVKLVINPRNGRILSRERIWRPHRQHRRHHHNYYYYGYGHPHNGFSWSFSYGR